MVFEPTRRYWRDDTRVTDAPVPVRVTAGQTATADLDPTGGTWCYAVTWTPDGDALPWTEYVLVPAGLETVEYRELQRLTRDAAQLLTGEDAVTAATALSRAELAAEDAAHHAAEAAALARPGFIVTEVTPGVLSIAPINGATATTDAGTGVLTLEVPA